MENSKLRKLARVIKMKPQQAGMLAVALVAVLLVGATFIITRGGLDTSVAGTTADLKLAPAASNLTAGAKSINLTVNTNSIDVNGVQVFINITGTVPSDIKFTAADLSTSGLSKVISEITTTASGKQLALAFVTSSPVTPFKNSANLAIGVFEFTAPSTGTMTMTFDSTKTKINDWNTLQNVAAFPTASVYTFGSGTEPPPPPPPTVTGVLKYSTNSNRSSSTNLNGATIPVGQVVYVWLDSTTSGPVEFYGNNVYYRTDNAAPWDLLGSDASGNAVGQATVAGTYSIEARFGGQSTTANFTVSNGTVEPPPPPDPVINGVLRVSTNANRTGSVAAEGYAANAGVPLFVWLETNATGNIEFYIDGALTQIEASAPYDLKGTNTAASSANPWNPVAGTYLITAKYDNLTKTASANITINSVVTPPPVGLECGLADVDNNDFLDIVDFAAFAGKYNETCTTGPIVNPTPQATDPVVQAVTYDYIIGENLSLPVRLYTINGLNNAVDLDVKVTNATITGFTPSTGGGWLSAIGTCDGTTNLFNPVTAKVCAAMAKSSPFAEGELVGTIALTLDKEGTVTVEKTAETFYSDGTTKVSKPGLIAQFTVGTPIDPPPPSSSGGQDIFCGYQDANSDMLVNVVDFSQFARRYRQIDCQVAF